MASTSTERPNFYELQYLGAADLGAVVQYGRAARARHDLGGHTWGIAAGLELVERVGSSGGVEVFLEPGYAWDGFGRPLSVLQPFQISAGLFAEIPFDLAVDGGSPEGRLVDVWIRYVEQPTSAAASGFEVCDGDGFSRVVEAFVVGVDLGSSPPHEDMHDEVTVGTTTGDAREIRQAFDPSLPLVEDEAIAQQTLPDDWGDRTWWIPLGRVRWLPDASGGTAGRFVERSEDDLTSSARLRRHAGVAGETFEAARGRIRLRDRAALYAPSVWSDDLVWVEGDLRVDGDAKLLDGRLVLRDAHDSDQTIKAQLVVGRSEVNDLADPGSDLWLQIGEAQDGKNRLVVGPVLADGDPPTPVLVVRDDATAGIGVEAPTRPLEILANGDQDDVLGLHSSAGLAWLVGLKGDGNDGLSFYRDEAGTPVSRLFLEMGSDARVGVGTTAPTAKLHVDGGTGVRQNDQYLSGDAELCVLGVNVHRSVDGASWVFPDPARPAFAQVVEADDELEWSLRASESSATQSFTYLMQVEADTGNTYLCPAKGAVGIGTTVPDAELDVHGEAVVTDALRVGPRAAYAGVGVVEVSGSGAALAFDDRGYGGGTLADGESWMWYSSGRKARLQGAGVGDVMAFDSDGSCGIGTTSPACRLHVSAQPTNTDAGDEDAHVALIQNTGADSTNDVLALKIGHVGPEAQNNFITFFDGDGAVGALQGNGTSVALSTSGADFAEYVPRASATARLRPGSVVGIRCGEVVSDLRDAEQVLVVSEHPIVLGNRPRDGERDGHEPVAMLGQVDVRVRGPVRAGDVLLPSGASDGLAVARRPDAVAVEQWGDAVGIAWAAHPGDGEGRVRAAVGLHAQIAVRALAAELTELRRQVRALRADRAAHELHGRRSDR